MKSRRKDKNFLKNILTHRDILNLILNELNYFDLCSFLLASKALYIELQRTSANFIEKNNIKTKPSKLNVLRRTYEINGKQFRHGISYEEYQLLKLMRQYLLWRTPEKEKNEAFIKISNLMKKNINTDDANGVYIFLASLDTVYKRAINLNLDSGFRIILSDALYDSVRVNQLGNVKVLMDFIKQHKINIDANNTGKYLYCAINSAVEKKNDTAVEMLEMLVINYNNFIPHNKDEFYSTPLTSIINSCASEEDRLKMLNVLKNKIPDKVIATLRKMDGAEVQCLNQNENIKILQNELMRAFIAAFDHCHHKRAARLLLQMGAPIQYRADYKKLLIDSPYFRKQILQKNSIASLAAAIKDLLSIKIFCGSYVQSAYEEEEVRKLFSQQHGNELIKSFHKEIDHLVKKNKNEKLKKLFIYLSKCYEEQNLDKRRTILNEASRDPLFKSQNKLSNLFPFQSVSTLLQKTAALMDKAVILSCHLVQRHHSTFRGSFGY